ncbi:MAG: thermonuclease family protein [Paracoccaceae bacterium]
MARPTLLPVLLLAILALLAAPAPVLAETVAGRADVLDGDTLDIGAERIRLFGIDAPEKAQTCQAATGAWACGLWAGERLRALTGGRRVTCEGIDRDAHGRLLARCDAGDGDLGALLVRSGASVAFLRYSTDYADEEKEAIFARAGVWQGAFQAPEDYRTALRAQVASAPQPAPDNCAIKGNVSASGRIYHMPGQENYDDTRIDPARGERWFCSETEARVAGWRRARR